MTKTFIVLKRSFIHEYSVCRKRYCSMEGRDGGVSKTVSWLVSILVTKSSFVLAGLTVLSAVIIFQYVNWVPSHEQMFKKTHLIYHRTYSPSRQTPPISSSMPQKFLSDDLPSIWFWLAGSVRKRKRDDGCDIQFSFHFQGEEDIASI